MPARPAFAPRDFLTVPDFFGVHEDVTWNLASDVSQALRLARSREQHELAYRIWVVRTEHKNSVEDIAVTLNVRRENLWAKLRGKSPATEEDLIRWSWLVDEPRRTFAPSSLWAEPFLVRGFPMMRNRLA